MFQLVLNGQRIPEEVIQAEVDRLSLDPQLQAIADTNERAVKTRQAAEQAVISRTLVEQLALADPRPLDPALVDEQVEREMVRSGCRPGWDDSGLRQGIEMQLRVDRVLADLVADAPRPTSADVEAFYRVHGHNFCAPEMFHASHIVKHVNENQSEDEARTGIYRALDELERGHPFATVAENASDCKGNGGDLGVFARGAMVPEFETVLDQLQPGERTGVFTTPFGFHIAQLHARQPGGSAPLEEVRGDIERVLTTAAEHQAFLAAVNKLRATAEIRRVPVEVAASAASSPK